MKARELLIALINASEKAANIARKCRSNQHLFSLLIEEKTGDEKNDRFFHDFKTLADVLIQETIRYDVGSLFPCRKDSIKGEESNKFENVLGDKVIIEIDNNQENTFEMLRKVLDNNDEAAKELTNEIHKVVDTEEKLSISDEVEIDFDIGIWIDPIDGTAEYINGIDELTEFPNIQKTGLQCATVLIGVYDKSTELPIIGVVCSPFATKDDDNYDSKIFYGISLNDIKYSNVQPRVKSRKIAITSSSEVHSRCSSFEISMAAGAGYKALKVIEGDADIYYLSKASTFRWDTCACQAILRALGGDIVEFKNSIIEKQPIPLKYPDNNEDKCNRNGLIAYRDVNDFYKLVGDLSDAIKV
ncbi:inositol polyphosphate 1-phosphatase [Chironomus tepperi]|uniref:inositol polyphosphate 1-phosphatase n=1 Tax=Chironomus tepperi TaxID=113505 RepID=UPI00391F3B64